MNAEATHALIDNAIEAFEAIEPRRQTSLRTALDKLRSLIVRFDNNVSTFLQQHFALFIDLPPESSDAEIDEIVKQFLGDMPVQAMEHSGIDLDNLGDLSEEQVSDMKRFGLFLLFCLKLALTIGVAGGSWFNSRQAIGGTIDTGRGQVAAITSGAAATLVLEVSNQLEGWLNASPAFVGEDVSALVEVFKLFVTNLMGATTWFGVLQIMEKDPTLSPYAIYGLFGLAFFFVGAINGAGELAVGKRSAIVTLSEEDRLQAQSALRVLFNRIADKKNVAQMLLNFLAWYSYWDYAEGFGSLARTRGQEQAILWGSLEIFFMFAAFGNYGIEKIFTRHRVSQNGGV